MLVEVTFQTQDDLMDKAPLIQNALGIPIVDSQNNVLTLETTPENDLDNIRAIRGVVSVEITVQ